ncbi:MAG: hypothetical protein ABI425_02625 [Patescibacteria group bacterium]
MAHSPELAQNPFITPQVKNKILSVHRRTRVLMNDSDEPFMNSKLGQAELTFAQKFAADIDSLFRRKFINFLLNYHYGADNWIGPTIVKMIAQHPNLFAIPELTVYAPEAGLDFIRQCELHDQTLSFPPTIHSEAPALLLNYQLPRVLGHYWWKGRADKRDLYIQDKEICGIKFINNMAIQWGDCYEKVHREATIRVMGDIGRSQKNTNKDANFAYQRLNDTHSHSPESYYLWQIVLFRSIKKKVNPASLQLEKSKAS